MSTRVAVIGIVVEDLVAKKALHARYIAVGFAHQPLDGINGVGRVGDEFFFGGITDEHTAIGGKMHHRRHQSRLAIGPTHADGLAIAQVSHQAIGGAEVNTDDDILWFFDAAVAKIDGKSGHEIWVDKS